MVKLWDVRIGMMFEVSLSAFPGSVSYIKKANGWVRENGKPRNLKYGKR